MALLKTVKNKIKAASHLGLIGAWHYFVVMPRILKTQPVTGLTDARCEVHAMTSRKHWLYLMWALKSFYAASGRRYMLCIHDDGTLPPRVFEVFRAHFPDARIVSRKDADAHMGKVLTPFPLVQKFRQGTYFAQKITDPVAYLQAPRMLVMDSDILWFREPVELLRRIEDPTYLKNAFNGDSWSTLIVSPDAVKAVYGVDLTAKLNAGLGLVHADSQAFGRMEQCIQLPTMPPLGHYFLEQNLQTVLSSIHGVELLPDEYTVDPSGRPTGNRPLRHYTSPIRHRMFSEGMRRLVAEGFLERKF